MAEVSNAYSAHIRFASFFLFILEEITSVETNNIMHSTHQMTTMRHRTIARTQIKVTMSSLRRKTSMLANTVLRPKRRWSRRAMRRRRRRRRR